MHYFHYTPDDAFIYFRYAQNFVNGKGLVFNVGERVEGYTSFLWLAILTLPTWLSIDVLLFAKMIGVFFLLAATVLYLRASGPVLKSNIPLIILAICLHAACVPLIVHFCNGLETALYATLFLSYSLLCERILCHEQGGRTHFAAYNVLAILLFLTRQESCLFVAIFFVFKAALSQEKRPGMGQIWQSIRFHLPWGVCALGFLCFRWFYYGELLPNTFYAKATNLGISANAAHYITQFLSAFRGTVILYLLAASMLIIRLLRYRRRQDAAECCTILFPLVQTIFVLVTAGDWMAFFRYFVPSILMMNIFVLRLLSRFAPRQRLLSLGVTALILIDMAQSGSYFSLKQLYVPSPLTKYNKDDFDKIAEYITAKTTPDTLVALMTAGYLAYRYHGRVLTTDGLIDKHIAKLPGALHEKADAAYIMDQKPKFIQLHVPLARFHRHPAGIDEPDRYLVYPEDRAIYHHPDFAHYQAVTHLNLSDKINNWSTFFERR